MSDGRFYVGTSGWVYQDWQGIFYPKELPAKDKLKYFSRHFKTTEINYSFYRLPRPATYQNWYSQVPADFVFAVKASRFITHIKRLKGVGSSWKQFLKNALNLKEKLGPILFQFPPSFKTTPENTKRLEGFLTSLRGRTFSDRGLTSVNSSSNLKYAMEFRHKSWCDEKIYKLFKKYNIAWVIADSPAYPRAEVITADFVYVRMHGSKVLFSSNYTKKELSSLAQKIKKWQKNYDIYVYFNNDFHGYAIENAKGLSKLLIK